VDSREQNNLLQRQTKQIRKQKRLGAVTRDET